MKRHFTLADLLKINGKKDVGMGMPFPCIYFDGEQAIAATGTMTVAIDCPQPRMSREVLIATADLTPALHLSSSRSLVLEEEGEEVLANGIRVSAYGTETIPESVMQMLQLDRPMWRLIVPQMPIDGLRWAQLLSASGVQDVRYYLNGVYVDLVAGALAATDGHRMHIIEDVIALPPNPLPEGTLQGVVIPYQAARFLSRVGGIQQMFVLQQKLDTPPRAKDGGDAVMPRLVCFAVANARIRCRAVDTATYPDYRRIFESMRNDTEILLLGQDVQRTLIHLAQVSLKGMGGRITLAHDGEALSVSISDRLQQTVPLPYRVARPFSITVNASYLIDVLMAASAYGATLKWRTAGETTTTFCVDSQDFHGVVMGVQVDAENADTAQESVQTEGCST